MSCRLSLVLPAVLLVVSAAPAAFELDDLETSLPFANHRGLIGNPAELAAVSCPTWELAHHLPFGLYQLSHHHLALALPRPPLGAGAGLGSTGFALHRETRAWLGAGLPLGSRAAVGASISALFLQQRTVSRSRSATLGLTMALGRQLHLSAWWRQGAGRLSPPQLFVKLTHRPDAVSAMYAHLHPATGQPPRLDLAAERWLQPQLRLCLGTRSTPRRFALGAGLVAGRWTLDYAVKTHPHLGPSHTLVVGGSCKSP